MKVGFLITGRMKSTRLKEKLTLKILDREVIAHMIDRAKLAFKPEDIVIATSPNPQDDILENISIREGINCFRGHEDDVVDRLYNAARKYNFDYIINITADCPLFGYDYVEPITEILKTQSADLVTSLDLPHGIFVYGIKTDALEKVIEMKTQTDTEVWGDYFYQNEDIFKVVKLPVPESKRRPDYRLTLDYPEDFNFFNEVYTRLGADTYKITSDDLVSFLDNNPEIVDINKDCKELYSKRWESQRITDARK